MKRGALITIFVGFALSGATNVFAQTSPFPSADFPAIYDRLSQKIERIPIYDNH